MEIALKKLGDIITGNTPSKKDDKFWDSADICFLKPDGIADEGITLINDSTEYISENARGKARIVSEDALFVTCIGIIGKVGIAGSGEYAFNQQINAIETNEVVLPRYLAYNLLFSKSRLVAMANAPVVPIINKTQFEDFIVNIEEDKLKQAEIVLVLDKLRGIIESRKKELGLFDDLIKARFIEMFGNILSDNNLPLVKLKELADIGSSKRIYANEYVEDGVPFYRSKEIRELGSGLKPSVELFISEERYAEIKEKYGVPKEGDILVAAIGATIGYSWIVNTDSPFYYKDGNLIILSIKDNVNPIFLNHTMGIIIEDFKNKGVAGSAQLALTIEKLEKMMVVNPDIDLQNQFAEFVKQVNKSKVAVQKALDEAQLLFDSLMQQYFG